MCPSINTGDELCILNVPRLNNQHPALFLPQSTKLWAHLCQFVHVIRCINGDRKHLFQIAIITSSPSLLSLLSSPSFCSVSSPSLSLFLLSLPPLRRPSFLLPCSSLSVFGEAAQIKLGSCGWSACFSQCFPIALCTCTVFFVHSWALFSILCL